MQYLITNDQDLKRNLWPIFNEAYSQFYNDRTSAEFEKIINHCIFASILLNDNAEPMSFVFHRKMECLDYKAPPEYMADAPIVFLKYICHKKFKLLTFEWVTVAKALRGKITPYKPSHIIYGLAFKFLQSSIFDAAMGFSRQDYKVDKLTMKFGTDKHGDVDRFGIKCSVVLVERKDVQLAPSETAQLKIEELWLNRINDFPHMERYDEHIDRKRAA